MKILAIILARSGSKRLLKKNKVNLGKKKLIEYTFQLSKKIKFFNKILLSSDDNSLIRLSSKYKILAPWKRPKNLCADNTPSYKAVIHAYDWFKKNYFAVDGIFILQPTSPFRTKKTVNQMVKIFKKNLKKSVVSVSPISEHHEWSVSIKNNRMNRISSINYFNKGSQKLKKLFKINGLGYLLSPKILKKEKTLVPKNSIPYLCKSRIETIDINDINDLRLARAIKK